jgi:hypothetical protein
MVIPLSLEIDIELGKYLGIIKNQILKPCAARCAGGAGF